MKKKCFTWLFPGNIYFLLGEVLSSEVQQHHWVSLVGLRSRLVPHPLFNPHGSPADGVQPVHHSWNAAAGNTSTSHQHRSANLVLNHLKPFFFFFRLQRFSALCTPSEDLPLTKSEKKALELLTLPSYHDEKKWILTEE